MAQKCRFCFIKSDDTMEICPVCKIPHGKSKRDLTREEKKVWHATIHLRLIGLLVCAGGLVGVLMSAPVVVLGEPKGFFGLAFSLFFVFFGYSLSRYKRWCYFAGIVIFSIALVASFIRLSVVSIIINGLFLYGLASPTPKKLLRRELRA